MFELKWCTIIVRIFIDQHNIPKKWKYIYFK